MTRDTRTVVVTVYTDDLTGEELPEGEGETVVFTWEGKKFEVDLSAANAEILRGTIATLERHAAAGREIKPKRQRPPRPRATASPDDPDSPASPPVERRDRNEEQNAAVRAWARRNGFNLADKGRIPQWAIDGWSKTQTGSGLRVVPEPPAGSIVYRTESLQT